MKKTFVIDLAICVLLIVASFSVVIGENSKNFDNIETSSHIKIEVENAEKHASTLLSDGFDVLRETVTKTTLELIVSAHELQILKDKGYSITILSIGRPFREIQNEQYAGFSSPPPGYPDLNTIIDEMNSTASNYPTIAKVFDLTSKYNAPPTYEGRHLYAIKISDHVSTEEDEPNFLMVSCHHAREIVTPVIALYAIDQFTSNYGSNPQITNFVNSYEIWICPVWNPDGYEYVFNVDNMWRKNRHPYYGYYGVDQNRNYPFGWDSSCGGSTSPSSETYRGPFAASEEETQTMIAFSNDQHFTKIIDYHSYAREVLYGYCCHSHPFSSYFLNEAVSISNAAGYGGSVRVPSAEGEEYEWQIAVNGSYANLMETHIDFQPSYTSAVAEAAQVWPSTLWILDRAIPLSGHVTDSVTGDPVKSKISLIGITFPNGEEFNSESYFGRYHIFMPSGTYNVKFEAPHYQNQTQQVIITSGVASILDVELVVINDPPYEPFISGTDTGRKNIEYWLTVQADDPDDDDLYYFVDWDDGTQGEWIGPYPPGTPILINHTWTESGTFAVKAKAKDPYGEESQWSNTINVSILENNIPTNPQIEGPTRGKVGEFLYYSFASTDAEADDVYYYIDWGDGNCEEWAGPYDSGKPITFRYNWTTKGNYELKAKAKDELGAESNWSTLNVKIPRIRVLNNQLVLRLLELFPILQKLIYLKL
jgi:hypothetical protein